MGHIARQFNEDNYTGSAKICGTEAHSQKASRSRPEVRSELIHTLSNRPRPSPAPPEPEFPMTVKDAARFLGVSPQTVYLWVERKQIPHLRVMGRNIRFLESDLRPFRAQFKQEVENGKTSEA
jgi:excisionase family DNA binding protein